MAKYTAGKYAKAICDRCGDKYYLKDLKKEWTGLKVCDICWDPKTKQEFPDRTPIDPESLHDPRPDNDKEANIGTAVAKDNSTGDTPIGSAFSQNQSNVQLGTVTVNIS